MHTSMLLRLLSLWLAGVFALLACRDEASAPPAAPVAPTVAPAAASEQERLATAKRAEQERLAAAKRAEQERLAAAKRAEFERDFPLHGLVSGVQLKIRKQPEVNAVTLGWLRVGSRIRLGSDSTAASDCTSGFQRLAPLGFVCVSEGISIGNEPPASALVVPPPAREAALPYEYYYVKEPAAAEYHRLPSREEQRAVNVFAERYLELRAKDPKKAQRLLTGELKKNEKKTEPARLEIVRRFIDRGFFIASTGSESRAARQYVRTVRGSYVKLTDLESRRGSVFRGVTLDAAHHLPVAWAVRAAQSFVPKLEDGGTPRLVVDAGSKTFERLALVPWLKRERMGDQIFHKLDDGHYLKTWYVTVAEAIARPKEIKANEPWVHVNLERQTLVAYHGDTAVYATLVSTGIAGHETKPGLFDIRSKHVTASMSDIGPDVSADLRYSIDDVPWTQYFSGSIALHGAFWHAGYGLPHSHGCVNLAPLDAHWLFDHTWPELAEGWHGVVADGRELRASKVLITEK